MSMDIRELEAILDTLERFTKILEEETKYVRNRTLSQHQDIIDEKARLVSLVSQYQDDYNLKDFESLSPTGAHKKRYERVKAAFGKAFKENGIALAAANRLYEIMLETINRVHYEAQEKPIGYSKDHGIFKSGKEVYDHVGTSAMKFSGQF